MTGDIVFHSYKSCQDTLYKMRLIASERGFVTVRDFYDICGIGSLQCDLLKGWTIDDLQPGTIKQRGKSGFIFEIKDPQELYVHYTDRLAFVNGILDLYNKGFTPEEIANAFILVPTLPEKPNLYSRRLQGLI